MMLMLGVIFLCIALGLVARRLGIREHLGITFLATVMTALYFFSKRAM